jgi:hypothetical protein
MPHPSKYMYAPSLGVVEHSVELLMVYVSDNAKFTSLVVV